MTWVVLDYPSKRIIFSLSIERSKIQWVSINKPFPVHIQSLFILSIFWIRFLSFNHPPSAIKNLKRLLPTERDIRVYFLRTSHRFLSGEEPTERAWMLFRVQVIYWICWEMMLISINLIRRVRSIRTAVACRARFDLSSLSCRDALQLNIQSGSIITLSTHFYSHLNNILWFCIVEELDLLNID